jgi:hypothetical protein
MLQVHLELLAESVYILALLISVLRDKDTMVVLVLSPAALPKAVAAEELEAPAALPPAEQDHQVQSQVEP